MKTLHSSQLVDIPEGVKVDVKNRQIRVTGPRGVLTRNFSHQNLDIRKVGKSKILIELWFGNRKQIAAVRTIASHINNLITGVTKGYEYKMRYVYAHFPINVTIGEDKKTVEIRNFIGERQARFVTMLPGVSVAISDKQKDELILTGNDLDAVSQSAANIQESTVVHNKDIRKFLDGIYVSESHPIGE